jgi:type I restriction enzyme R subunit
MTISFANNNLNGHTRFKEGYKSAKTRICVTVGMMTTGYDCKDILNICMLRPIFSPTDFVQIRGRGTRTYTFKYIERQAGQEAVVREKKKGYKLFDFFANCEYFEEKYPYDAVLKPPKEKGKGGGGPGPEPPPPPVGVFESGIEDPLKHIYVTKTSEEEWRIDRELYSGRFENKVKETYGGKPGFKDAVDSGDYEEMERFVKEHLFDKPEDYFNLDKLRRSYGIDRRLSLWEILDKIFGKIPQFKTRDELAEEEFERFMVSSDTPPDLYYETREFFKMYVLDEEARVHINQKDFAWFMTDPTKLHILQALGQDRLRTLPEYIKDHVNLNKYMH